MRKKFVQTLWNKVPLVVVSLFSQLKKVQQAFPGATLPKLSQALASFPAMPFTLPLRCFSAQSQRKILTKTTNEISTCCKPGHEVVERNLVTVRQMFPEKELDSCILIPDQTVLLLSLPPPPPANAPNKADEAGLHTKLCEQEVFFSSTKEKELQTSHVLQTWAPCSWQGEKQARSIFYRSMKLGHRS